MLEIGTGSGYQAAMLSRLAREVVTLERYRTLAERRASAAQDARLRQRQVLLGDGFAGVPSARPTTASSSPRRPRAIPQALIAQLAEGGIMVLPLGPHDGAQELVKLTKTGQGAVAREPDRGAFVPLLPGQAREL